MEDVRFSLIRILNQSSITQDKRGSGSGKDILCKQDLSLLKVPLKSGVHNTVQQAGEEHAECQEG